MSLVMMWLIGWAVCSVGSGIVFAWWMHASKRRVIDGPVPVTAAWSHDHHAP